jgi:hypothetical protein
VPESVRNGRLAQERDCLANRIAHLVERGNHCISIGRRSDLENYFNGDIQFTFEQPEAAGDDVAKLGLRHTRIEPFEIGVPKLEKNLRSLLRQAASRLLNVGHVWNCGGKNVQPDFSVVYRWNEQSVLVHVIGFPHQEEHFVASRSTVGPYISHSAVEPCTASLGVSVMKGFAKLRCFAGKGKLDEPPFLVARAMRRDDFPINVVESAAQVVNNVAADGSQSTYYGFVLFGRDESLSGLKICFDNQYERSRFLHNFVKFSDMFRGPINLEKCAVCHG